MGRRTSTAMPTTPNTAACRRSVLSCVRCRKRKSKCDRQLPSCSQCVAVGEECRGFNSARGAAIPRSIVHHLENEIASLELKLAELGCDEAEIQQEIDRSEPSKENPSALATTAMTDGPSQVSSEMEIREQYDAVEQAMSRPTPNTHSRHRRTSSAQDATKERVIASAEIQSMINATLPVGPSLTDVVRRVRMGLTPSLVLSSEAKEQAQIKTPAQNRDSEPEVDVSILASLPSHVVHTLVRKYVQRMLPVHPFLYEPTIWEQLDRVLLKIPRAEGGESCSQTVRLDYDFLVIYLILSVSTTLGSAKVGQGARCMAFSEALFKEGIRHLSQTAAYPSDMAWIQVTLLILQYASINPKLGNVWILSGFAMRNCLELGLHREVSESMGLDPLTIDLRRRIFWAAYCMDRSICAALQRPLSIPDPAIDTSVMSVLEDRCITSHGLDHRGQATKKLAIRWIEYRQVQSTIIEVHFQSRLLDPQQTWQEWLAVTERRLWEWYQSDLPHDGWTEFALMHGLVMLHRPSSRAPLPSSTSMSTAFEAACSAAKSCRGQILSGYFPRPWLAAHHTFEMALVVLFCLRHNFEAIALRFSPNEIFEMTKLFTSNLLTISGQGWTEVSAYAAIYERLLSPLLDAIFTRSRPVSRAYTPEQETELARLLYPSPAHRQELRFADIGGASVTEDHFSFDAGIFDWDDDLLAHDTDSSPLLVF
ncbi:Fungal specific transcription factor domain-containing protein isoform 3 [Cladophialophora immunda]|nr:Fungal specific transcription factor domain-containing protein isoform 2 [Cladophialophora immunda]OQU95408.1 Fungal specific transcription factor domain-containing protein isoform 3 [Cladophialophora immunda]